jgi:hypothetical protein
MLGTISPLWDCGNAQDVKVFWFFFSKKNRFLVLFADAPSVV